MDLNTNLPKIACFCLFLGLPKHFTPTSQFFYTDISVISVTFCNSVIIITMAYPHIPTRQILRMTLMLKSGCWDSMYFSKVNKCLVFVEYRQSLETTKKMDNPGDETDLREFCFYIYDLNGDGYISRQHHLYLWPSVTDHDDLHLREQGGDVDLDEGKSLRSNGRGRDGGEGWQRQRLGRNHHQYNITIIIVKKLNVIVIFIITITDPVSSSSSSSSLCPWSRYNCAIFKVDITMKKMDGDKDGRVSFGDYTEMVGW